MELDEVHIFHFYEYERTVVKIYYSSTKVWRGMPPWHCLHYMKKAMTVDNVRIVDEEQATHAEAVKDQHEESVWRVVKEE